MIIFYMASSYNISLVDHISFDIYTEICFSSTELLW